MKGLILLLTALIMFIPLTVLNVFLVLKKRPTWKQLDGYFYQTAFDIDRFGNHNFRTLFNATLIMESGYQFGDFRETISSVLGKNERNNTLLLGGKLVVSLLNLFDKDHCIKSIKNLTDEPD